jgi:hypothetical protein
MAKFVDEAIGLLGFPGKDKVTGFEGVVDSICFDLYGCVQVALKPQKLKDDGGIREGVWFDVHRIDVSSARVMKPRDFTRLEHAPTEYDHGPADKPTQRA